MKSYEQVIKSRLVAILEKSSYFSKFQAAYRKRRSTCDHLLAIQEIFLHYRFNKIGPRGGIGKQLLYLCFMDLKKAFDMVPSHILFAKLKSIGVDGKILNIIKDLYDNNEAVVRVGDYISDPFTIETGVMQGSKLGPILFLIYINDLLQQLEDSKLGVNIWGIIISALGFADDIILIADRAGNLQKLIDICSEWSKLNGMSFNIDKCKVMPLNSRKKQHIFTIDQKILEVVKEYKYLGIILSNSRLTSLISKHIAHIIEKADKRINCIKHLGFQSDGLRPETTIEMYKILVRPILEYASQVLTYEHHYYNQSEARPSKIQNDQLAKLEKFQNRILKFLVPCPQSTPPALLRL